MAGSLNHITDIDGKFTMDTIENMRDAREALEECHQIIAELLVESHRDRALNRALDRLGFPQIKAVPILQPELMGPNGWYRSKEKSQ